MTRRALNITSATNDELYEIAAFLNDCWQMEYSKIVARDYLYDLSVDERYERLLVRFDDGSSDFYICRNEGLIVGAAVFGKSFTEGYPEDGEISAIYLRHDYIGKGYGHALFVEIEAALSAKGYSHYVLDVLSDNSRAVAFYQKHGYSVVDNRFIRLGECDYPLTVLRKKPHALPSPYPRAYVRLGHITPIPADCGQLCGKRCCKGREDDGMILFPGENCFPPSFHITDRTINGHPIRFAVCTGQCRREARPLSCRIYPFAPYLDETGTLSVIPDPRAKYVCPLLSESALPLIDRRFRKAVLGVFTLLLDVDGMRPMLAAYSRMLDDYKRFVG